MNQKGSVLLIVVLLFAALAGFLIYSKNQISVSHPVPDPIRTFPVPSDWLKYTNPKIDLAFQYPKNWNIKDTKKPSEEIDEKIEITGPEGSIDIVAWNEGYGGGCDPKDQLNIRIFDGIQMVCHGIDKNGIESWNGITKTLPTGYVMSINATANSPSKVNSETIIDILSTFKSLPHTQSDETVNWKTYTSKNMGISFIYPDTYTYPDGESPRDDRVAIISPLKPNHKGYSLEDGELKVEIVSQDIQSNDILNQLEEESKKNNPPFKSERIVINGQEALHIKYDEQFFGEHYFLIHNSKKFSIDKYPTITSRDNEFKQILSTFKFIN